MARALKKRAPPGFGLALAAVTAPLVRLKMDFTRVNIELCERGG